MTDEKQNPEDPDESSSDLSRREFVAISLGVGLAAGSGVSSAAALDVVETNVQVKTPDGTCDAVFIHPTSG